MPHFFSIAYRFPEQYLKRGSVENYINEDKAHKMTREVIIPTEGRNLKISRYARNDKKYGAPRKGCWSVGYGPSFRYEVPLCVSEEFFCLVSATDLACSIHPK